MSFYEDGLKFTCRRCGDCCKGADAYVWLYLDDLARAAEFLGISESEFRNRYTGVVDKALVLTSFPNGDCIFYEEKIGCRIHGARPIQCEAFPFWPEYLRNPGTWAMAGKRCPGVGTGEIHSKKEIEKQLRKLREF